MAVELNTTSLSQARLARGLTIEDAERSTRISRRFLIALEEHNYTVFPAPIYARGFLRTYCRYLGVDAEERLAELPEGWAASTPTTHLPPVSRGTMTFNPVWLVAGILLMALAGLGVFLARDSSDLTRLEAQAGDESSAELAGDGTTTAPGSGTSTETPATQVPAQSVTARPLNPGLPGLLPDFTYVNVDDVTRFLASQDLAYLRIDTASTSTPLGLVISQSPSPGSSTGGLSQVTLTVSAGPTVDATSRQDCDVLAATNRRTTSEQSYFEANCGEPTAVPDRTDCEEIRGTDYRSTSEREFFLANCITQ